MEIWRGARALANEEDDSGHGAAHELEQRQGGGGQGQRDVSGEAKQRAQGSGVVTRKQLES